MKPVQSLPTLMQQVKAKASGVNSIAWGVDAEATNTNSMAIGVRVFHRELTQQQLVPTQQQLEKMLLPLA